jgi:hypothetical protein
LVWLGRHHDKQMWGSAKLALAALGRIDTWRKTSIEAPAPLRRTDTPRHQLPHTGALAGHRHNSIAENVSIIGLISDMSIVSLCRVGVTC